MKNWISEGRSLDLTAPAGGVVSGKPVKIGAYVVVPSTTAA
jgi:predicted RecA/RadA family phage recombinase